MSQSSSAIPKSSFPSSRSGAYGISGWAAPRVARFFSVFSSAPSDAIIYMRLCAVLEPRLAISSLYLALFYIFSRMSLLRSYKFAKYCSLSCYLSSSMRLRSASCYTFLFSRISCAVLCIFWILFCLISSGLRNSSSMSSKWNLSSCLVSSTSMPSLTARNFVLFS